jgi:uncharacterized membrane protein
MTGEGHFRKPPWGGLIVPALMLVVVLFVIAAPLLEGRGRITLGEEGEVGGHEHEEAISDMEHPLSRAIYSAGDVYCHQKEHRTLFINGNPMPVCSRDLGVFIGMVIGGLFAAVFRGRFSFAFFTALVLPMAFDGTLQLFTRYESWNALRLVTGLLGGFGIAWMLNSAFMFVSGDHPSR